MSMPVSICVAENYVWVQDKNRVVWVAKSTEPSLIWRKLDIKASSLSVAPSGIYNILVLFITVKYALFKTVLDYVYEDN